MNNFVHLHNHTEYSLLNGAIKVSDLVRRAKELGMSSVAMTDYGNVFGAVEFFQAAKKEGIHPVLGCELFLPSYDDHKLKQYKRTQDQYWQIVVLVQNEVGYKNLSKMVTQSYLEGFYYKPRVDKKLLEEYNEGLIALSSGFNSELNSYLFQDQPEKAKEAAKRYAEIFKGRYYIELQDNGLPGQMERNQQLVEIAQELNLPLVATNNVHYIEREDAEAFDVLRAIQMGRAVSSFQDQIKFSTDAYHFRDQEEMAQLFSAYPEAIANTAKIAEQCQFEFEFGKYHLPNYKVPEGMTLDGHMVEEAKKGFEELWPHIKKTGQVAEENKKIYLDRLNLELDVIQNMGFSGYFLIVSDFIKWAKSHDIPVGPGRGSGAGSLVAYSLRITDLDPLPYHLLFERFLNPERISMPDFDIDFCQDRRGEVIDYVSEKYGNVSQIITFGKMKAKAVVRDVGRVMELEYDYVDKIAKLIPNELNITLQKALDTDPDLKDLYRNDDTVHRLIDTSLRLEGLSRHASVHAAGVIITDQPLWNLVPLYKGSSDDVVVQYDMKSAEQIGLIKFDFLGLKTLTVIRNALENVKKSHDKEIDIESIPMTDEKVYETLSKGQGCGVFQLESSGMCDLMRRLKPGCFEDIIALVALYRPGPLGSGMVDDFIDRKKGDKEIEYPLPQLEEILKDTYGVIVYQEQVMQIAAILANYSLGEADLLRRAMGKKKKEEMDKQRKRFLEGSEQNQISQDKAEAIFDLMAKFAEYGFNKSHSAAYALISYQTAFLKTHYPAEYMAAVMTSEKEDTDKLLVFLNESKKMGLEFLPPDINKSDKPFTVEDGKIRYALSAIKGVGESAIDSVLQARQDGPFQSFFDLVSRADLRRVTKKVLEMLVKAGALDIFGMPRKALLAMLPNVVDAAARRQKAEELGQFDLFGDVDKEAQTPVGIDFNEKEDWLESEKLGFEKEAYGFYFSGHPLSPYRNSLKKLTTAEIVGLSDKRHEETVLLGGVLIGCREITTKKGDRMAFLQFEDLTGQVEVIAFPRVYKEFREEIHSEEPLIFKGSIDRSQENVKILVESVSKLTENLKQSTRSIHLEIPVNKLTKQKLDGLVDALQEYSGQSLVYLHIKKDHHYETVLKMPQECRAMACEPLMFKIDRLFDGEGGVHFQ